MTFGVLLAVLGAAFLHAFWNAMVKSGADQAAGVGAITLGHLVLAIGIVPFVPPPDPAAYGFLLAGVALHLGYQVFLIESYRIGDLTQVYPIARGVAPLVVAGVSVAFLGVHLAPVEFVSILLIALGILSLALVRRDSGLRNTPAAGLALVTGLFIAGYSLVDGLGARLSGHSLSYYAWLSMFNATLMACYLRLRFPGTLRAIPRLHMRILILGGGASFAAYAIVIWAFTQAPIALVTALRETSIIFALLIGVGVMKERLDLAKVAATAATFAGVILLRFAR